MRAFEMKKYFMYGNKEYHSKRKFVLQINADRCKYVKEVNDTTLWKCKLFQML